MKVVYIAGKFRGPTAWAVELHVRAAEELGYRVASAGAAPLIPHTNTRFFNGTLDETFWLEATMALLRKCDAVLTVQNWRGSVGASAEVAEALRLGIPVFYHLEDLRHWIALQRAVEATGP